MHIFDRTVLTRHRDRAANSGESFLFDESAERLCDRLDDIKRTFPTALDLGCRSGHVAERLRGRGGVQTVVQAELSQTMAQLAGKNGHATVVADEEALPFAPGSFDLVLSNLALHWVNDLPGALIQTRKTLKPDGLLLASLLGERTLNELRESLMAAEMEIEGGISPRVSPFATVQDLGALLGRAGFTLPVVDVDTITVSYAEPMKLLHDLRAMGETGAVVGRRKAFTRRDTLLRAMEIYTEKFTDADGRVPATFDILTMTAWSPGPGQPEALKPGSARVNLIDALADDAGDD